MSNGLNFTKEFEAEGRLRAIELLLAAIVETHPDAPRLHQALNQLIDRDEALLVEKARMQLGDAPASALTAVNGRMADVRDSIERIIRGRLASRQQSP